MATINYTLQKISSDLFIKYNSKEREYIDQKITNFHTSIHSYFGDNISEVQIFGSYKRDTILPRKFDEESDIDVLIVFNQAQNEYKPETYRNRLKKFAEKKYSTTKILKDHPSVVLEMSSIKFDLVPCRLYRGFFSTTYQIPSKEGDWMDTYPKAFNEKLTSVNNKYDSIVKPIIRLLKRWNAYNSYPYATFELEQIVADLNFNNDNLQKGFLYAVNNLPVYDLSASDKKKVEVLKNNKKWIDEYLDRDNQEKAIEVVCRILGVKI
ncbi:MAG: nucleotidyltransferase domain-containing protein [Bacteroidota bacterium]|nr:nucleotidyltransferase domain-containing protein [Bacteroidota bacterium]